MLRRFQNVQLDCQIEDTGQDGLTRAGEAQGVRSRRGGKEAWEIPSLLHVQLMQMYECGMNIGSMMIYL